MNVMREAKRRHGAQKSKVERVEKPSRESRERALKENTVKSVNCKRVYLSC